MNKNMRLLSAFLAWAKANGKLSGDPDLVAFEYSRDVLKKPATKTGLNSLPMAKIKVDDVDKKLQRYFLIANAFRLLFIKNQSERGAPVSHQEGANFKSYVEPIRLLFEADKATIEQMEVVYRFLQGSSGDFWKPNILSTSKLRKQFTRLVMEANKSKSNGKLTREEIAQRAGIN